MIGNTGFPVLYVHHLDHVRLPNRLSLYKESLGFFSTIPAVVSRFYFFGTNLVVVFYPCGSQRRGLDLFVVPDGTISSLSSYQCVGTGDGRLSRLVRETAGFSVLDLSKLHSAVQVSYMLMMYISESYCWPFLSEELMFTKSKCWDVLAGRNHEDDHRKTLLGPFAKPIVV